MDKDFPGVNTHLLWKLIKSNPNGKYCATRLGFFFFFFSEKALYLLPTAEKTLLKLFYRKLVWSDKKQGLNALLGNQCSRVSLEEPNFYSNTFLGKSAAS